MILEPFTPRSVWQCSPNDTTGASHQTHHNSTVSSQSEQGLRGGAGPVMLYGYTGRLEIAGSPEEFRAASLRLAYCDTEGNLGADWQFAVDIWHENDGESKIMKTFRVSRTGFLITFEQISCYYGEKIFIRRTSDQEPKVVEPGMERRLAYLQLDQSSDAAYWIIPDDIGPKYGINRIQESFSAAMRVLGFNRQLQRGSVTIGGIKMGWAATDVTVPLLNHIKKERSLKPDIPIRLEVQVIPKVNRTLSGIRLVGTNDSELFQVGELGHGFEEKIYESMVTISERQFTKSSIVSFKLMLWLPEMQKTTHFAKDPKKKAIAELNSFYKDLDAKCLRAPLVFWLIYDRFTIYDVDNPKRHVLWNTNHSEDDSTLMSFRGRLQELWEGYDQEVDLEFCLAQPETDMCFFIGAETTERHWSDNVLRWAQSPRLRVKRRATCAYGGYNLTYCDL